MDGGVVLLGADALLAVVDVLAPPAPGQAILVADAAADRAGFQEVSDNVPRMSPPVLQHLSLFPDSCQIVLAEHVPLPLQG